MPKVTQLELGCTDYLAPGHFFCCFRYPKGDQSAQRTLKSPVTILIGLISNNQEISATSFFCLHLQNKEIEELTKICDELIAKMGKS